MPAHIVLQLCVCPDVLHIAAQAKAKLPPHLGKYFEVSLND